MRVYELAKELGVQSKEVLAVLHEKGIDASNHMAVLSDKAVAHVRGKLDSKSVKKKESVAQPARTVAAKDLQIKKQEKTENKTIKKEEPVVHASAAKKTVPVEKVKIEAEKRVVEKVVEKPKIVVGASQEIERSMPEELRNKDIEPVELRPPVKLPVGNLEDIEEQELREQERIRRLLKTPSLAGFAVGLQPQARRRRRRRSRPAAETIAQQPKGPITEITVDGSKALYEVADMLGKNSGDLILYFLKKGSAWNRNHVLDVDVIREVAQHFGIAAHIKKTEEAEKKTDIRQSLRDVQEGVARWPVVVVMGHVDHGKTTLLDYIRKMNVAATEKGGITQHIRAWDVDSVHGKIVFLDTPGHEAFSYLRQRGSHITDVVVLVVAADDGIMPQTVEAIKYAKEASVPIVVAINKIDKASSPAALETVKRQLAQHDLMPEEWGGETVIVPVSAKTGKGVDELLEMIVLQSQLLDLKADVNKPAKAFVLESNIEKGLGPVATVICKEGILKPGDYFTCGTTTGKVRILIDSRGKKLLKLVLQRLFKLLDLMVLAVLKIGSLLSVSKNMQRQRAAKLLKHPLLCNLRNNKMLCIFQPKKKKLLILLSKQIHEAQKKLSRARLINCKKRIKILSAQFTLLHQALVISLKAMLSLLQIQTQSLLVCM